MVPVGGVRVRMNHWTCAWCFAARNITNRSLSNHTLLNYMVLSRMVRFMEMERIVREQAKDMLSIQYEMNASTGDKDKHRVALCTFPPQLTAAHNSAD